MREVTSNVSASMPLWMKTILNSFIAQLSLSKSNHTVLAYQYDVSRFLEYLQERKVRRLSSLKSTHIIDYLGECKKRGNAESSVNRYYMSIRAFARWLRRTKQIGVDITEDITPPRSGQKAPHVPTKEEIYALLMQPETNTESGARDKAILELLYGSGLRASELCELEISDYKVLSVTVKCGKRDKARSVPLTEAAREALDYYIDSYRGREEGYLFVTLKGKRLRRQLLCSIVMDYARKAGLQGVTTHTLRHACATHLLDAGADLRMIQEVLGHSSISSTQRYTHLSSKKIEEMFNNFHPRKRE